MISRSHPVARRLRALRRDRALRDLEGVFVAEGIHLAGEALRAGASTELAVVTSGFLATSEGGALTARLRAEGVPVHETSDQTMDALQDARSPQPVVLLVRRRPTSLDAVVRGRGGTALLVVSCGVQDPGNLGSIVRTADAAGATGLVGGDPGCDPFHPRAVRASMGSVFRLPVVAAGAAVALAHAAGLGLTIVAGDPRADTGYDAIDWRGPVALVLGSEGAGVPGEVAALVDVRIGIPLAFGVESLSVGASAAVLLFEAARARRGAKASSSGG